MVFEGLFGGEVKGLEEDDYIELDAGAVDVGQKVSIKVDNLEDFGDTDRLQKQVRDGAVVLAKIKALKDKDMSELKRAIDKLRKTCVALNGDIAGIDEDWIILCPGFARVHRD